MRFSPSQLGLPSTFASWRPGQWDAVTCFLDTDKRVGALCLPTGAGKSAIYMGLAQLLGGRTAILVSTRGLQDQVAREFRGLRLADFRGAQNYPCRAVEPGGELQDYRWSGRGRLPCDLAPCHAGVACSLMASGCPYYDARRAALTAPLVLTNYSAYLAQYLHGQGLGSFDTLILDEAHECQDELTRACSVEMRFEEIEALLACAYPHDAEIGHWVTWGEQTKPVLKALAGAQSQGEVKRLLRIKQLMRAVEGLARVREEEWIAQEQNGGIRFEPIYIEKLTEPVLFRGSARVLLVGATVRRKTLALLGCDPDQCELFEGASGFPAAHRPIIHIPTVQMNHRTSYEELTFLVKRLDQIIRTRLDRKGIIHCTSYARRDFVLQHSEFSHLMLTHSRDTAQRVIQEFKARQAPGILLSPSVTTGYDFPDAASRYQVLLKLPYPDTRAPIMQMRAFRDPDYPAYLAAQTLIQTVGRIVRSEDDWGESFVIDDNVRWFSKKYRDFFPAWFWQGYSIEASVPPAPALDSRPYQ